MSKTVDDLANEVVIRRVWRIVEINASPAPLLRLLQTARTDPQVCVAQPRYKMLVDNLLERVTCTASPTEPIVVPANSVPVKLYEESQVGNKLRTGIGLLPGVNGCLVEQ